MKRSEFFKTLILAIAGVFGYKEKEADGGYYIYGHVPIFKNREIVITDINDGNWHQVNVINDKLYIDGNYQGNDFKPL